MPANVEVPRSGRPRKDATRHVRATLVVGASTLALAACIVLLSVRAARGVNRVPLSDSPRAVTVVPARSATYRDARTYVGAIEPWVEASVGPQYISAYVETVLVRPGARVRRGQVLATLDCSHPSAETRAVEMRARAVDAQLKAAADEAARYSTLLPGGFVAKNEAEQKNAMSTAARAEFLETKARLLKASLDVQDCVLRAPFDGEVGTRSSDPGAFVRPGTSIVSVVDRAIVRVVADAPEKDFAALAPSTLVGVHLLATDAHLSAPIARRAPRADPDSRTIHFEVDISDPTRQYPVNTTAIVGVGVGKPVHATEVPAHAAVQQGGKAKLFVVEAGIARSRTLEVLGEVGGTLFFAPSVLGEGTLVVTEGRQLLSDGDAVRVRIESGAPDAGAPGRETEPNRRGGGYGRPL